MVGKFLDGDNDSSDVIAYDTETERKVAENIFDWWVSKLSYKEWYSQRFLQNSLFEEEL